MNNISRTLRRAALIATPALLLTACGGLLGPTEAPPQIYVLHPQFAALPNARETAWQFGVTEPIASGVLDTKRITLTRGQTMDYYADSAWTDQAPDMIQALLVEALEKSGKIKAVGSTSGGVRGDLLLVTELRDFSAHYDSENGAPRIVIDIEAKLVTATRHDVVATFHAHQEVQASVNSVPAVVQAFNQVTGTALESVAEWSLNAATPQASDALSPTTAEPVAVRRHRRRHH